MDLLTKVAEEDGFREFRYIPCDVIYEHKPTGRTFSVLPYQRQLDRYNLPTLATVSEPTDGLSETFQVKDWFVKVEEPTEHVEKMVAALQKHGLTDDEGEQFKDRYRAMNLNGAFLFMSNPQHRRKPYRMLEPMEYGADYVIPPLDLALLTVQALKFQIHI